MRHALKSRSSLAVSCALLAALAGTAGADVTPNAGMLRFPDVSKDQICFVYANDLWVVPRDGGVASPLASPPGQESLPKFSPDGKTIAFGGNYDGNRDLYTMPVTGGIATRVTHHPAGEALSDWTPDGKLMFISNGLAGLGRQAQIFTVSASGGLPEKLPVPYGAFGSISPDGTWLVYTPHSTDNRTWKRYRGGMATDLWLFNLKDKSAKKITDWEGTDTLPMFVPGGDGAAVYYLTDNGPEHRLNIWSYTIATGKREQVTSFKDDDVRWPSVGPGKDGKGEIVFQLGSELRLLNLATGRDTVVKVTIPGDRPKVRVRAVDAAKNITGASISPSGKRVAVEGRGDIWSSPAKEGVVRNLTRTDGVFERDPSWSPDGKWIAYFSDESGEYELWVRPSDSKPAEEAEKKDGEKKDGEKKGDEKKDDADKKDDGKKAEEPPKAEEPAKADESKKTEEPKKAEPKPPPRKLTALGAGFRYNPAWSPDSKLIAFTDQAGRLYLTTVETGDTKLVETDPWSNQLNASWSHDSQWMAYTLSDEASGQGCVWLYNVKTGKGTRVTSPMFAAGGVTFDRKGDFLFFESQRSINSPTYSDLDSTFVYTGTGGLYMVPLRADLKNPWLPKSDEEEIKKEEPKKDEKAKGDKAKDDKKEDKDKKNGDKPAGEAVADDGVTGAWAGTATGSGQGFPPGGVAFTLSLKLAADGTVTGSAVSVMGTGKITGTYEKSGGKLTITLAVGDGAVVTMTGTITGGEITGTWTAPDGSGAFTAKRSGSASATDEKAGEKDKAAKEVKIDLEGFERRAMALPIGPGSFGRLSATDDGKLVYARLGARGAGDGPSIKIFDPKDDAREEKTVTAGAGFEVSADGKKLLVMRGGGSLSVMDAAAGGGKSTSVVTSGMRTTVDPRNEWRQILWDVYRLERDFFYEPTLHGVNWAGMRDHYLKMLDDCASREDVGYVIGEFISELNIGHAYVTAPGDVESQPNVSVGMLGCDFELVTGENGTAYKIAKIYEGGPWDSDARGPLSQPGVNVKEGEFLLAVDGVAVDAAKDPWAALIDTADRVTTLTVGTNPAIDEKSREVVVKPIGGEGGLRYRAWIEHNRKYVEEKTQGQVGYIYVPDTGVNGQNDLFRQFFGQRAMAGLIIDERWNGGGQIPTRFIELLNRPIVNYWARRDGKDWPWPPDSHPGPKCMLANGLAGSGGDDFPWLFKHNKIGKVIGTRTWGGLVGISGNPGLIDGGGITVPTFGFYENDGTWGVEGHGVDPDIEVIDDPSKMTDGGDPQLDAAIAHMLEEVKNRPFVAPKRPASPDRSGMGIRPEDR